MSGTAQDLAATASPDPKVKTRRPAAWLRAGRCSTWCLVAAERSTTTGSPSMTSSGPTESQSQG